MNKKKLIELTNKIYKLTLLFPKKEPLRYRMRDVADRVLESFIAYETSHSPNKDEFLIRDEMNKDLEVIDAYFEVIKWQNWVSYFDILSMKDEYGKIKDSLPEKVEASRVEPLDLSKKVEKIEEVRVEDPVKELGERKDQPSSKTTARQRKILEILKEKEVAQVWEVNKILPDVSKRTLRRDFEQLLKQGFVRRIGEGNKTFYKLM